MGCFPHLRHAGSAGLLAGLVLASLGAGTNPDGPAAGQVRPSLPADGAAPAAQAQGGVAVRPLDSARVRALAAAIDQCVEKKLKEKNLSFNRPAGDAEFLRRAWLDAAGRVPTAQEAQAFLKDGAPDKRAKLVDSLLASPGYAMRQFNWLADMLRVKDQFNRGSGLLYADWLKTRIASGTPWDELVRQMVCAEGKLCDNGATGFLLRDADMPLDGMSNLMTTFLGANVACAQCHNHPFADWTQRDFYQMAAFFSATSTRDGRSARDVFKRAKDDELPIPKPLAQRIVFANILQVEDVRQGHLRLPANYKYDDAKPNAPVSPQFLAWDLDDAKGAAYRVDLSHPKQWRASFAAWLTHPDNPRFAANIANRTWKKLFGQGVQEPVGDLDNLAAGGNPELLALLAQTMKEVRFDLCAFQRVVMNTRAYQAAAQIPAGGSAYVFQGPLLRRMDAEQAWDSIVLLAVGPEVDEVREQRGKLLALTSISGNDFSDENLKKVAQKMEDAGFGRNFGGKNAEKNAKKAEKINEKLAGQAGKPAMMDAKGLEAILNNYTGPRPKGFGGAGLLVRASELQQPAPETHFLRVFGQSDRLIPSSSANDGSVPQALTLMNGPAARVITDRQSEVLKAALEIKSPPAQVEFLWLSFYARRPTAAESQEAQVALARGATTADLAWCLLNSHEFLFIQ